MQLKKKSLSFFIVVNIWWGRELTLSVSQCNSDLSIPLTSQTEGWKHYSLIPSFNMTSHRQLFSKHPGRHQGAWRDHLKLCTGTEIQSCMTIAYMLEDCNIYSISFQFLHPTVSQSSKFPLVHWSVTSKMSFWPGEITVHWSVRQVSFKKSVSFFHS